MKLPGRLRRKGYSGRIRRGGARYRRAIAPRRGSGCHDRFRTGSKWKRTSTAKHARGDRSWLTKHSGPRTERFKLRLVRLSKSTQSAKEQALSAGRELKDKAKEMAGSSTDAMKEQASGLVDTAKGRGCAGNGQASAGGRWPKECRRRICRKSCGHDAPSCTRI